MKVIKADKAGFCFGVQRAVDQAFEETAKGQKTYSYGQLIHNDQVSSKLAEQGLEEVERLSEVPSGKVIVRSHGVGADFYQESQVRNLEVVDCTCPFVKKVHRIVDKYYKAGYGIIIIGDAAHPEVIGINGWCDNQALIFNKLSDIPVLKDDQYCVVAQTTLKYQTWVDITEVLKQKVRVELHNTICSATSERQEAARLLAAQVDCMVVIGGYHSSNTRKLFEICRDLCKNTIHIEKKSDLVVTNVKNCGIIGITAGASTPDWIIDEVYDFLIQLQCD